MDFQIIPIHELKLVAIHFSTALLGLMVIKVKVKPRSRKNEVRKLPDGSWVVCVKAPPTDGAANEMLRQVLADHLDKPKRNVIIKSGLASRFKILEIL